MNPADWIEATNTYASSYGEWFISVLTRPSHTCAFGQAWVSRNLSPDKSDERGKNLPAFLLISLFLGVTLGAVIPGRPPIQDRAVIAVVVTVLWVFLSLLIHGGCRIVGGKGKIQVTIAVMLQVLAVVYVVSNFLTLIIEAAAASYSPLHQMLASLWFGSKPGEILFVIQFKMLLIYVALSVSRAHGFKGFRMAFVALFSAGCAVLFGIPVFAMGGC
jgi:hypothetical protein